MLVSGTFEVELRPLEGNVVGEAGVRLGRMGIEKRFKGALTAVSQGEMLSAVGRVKGSAGYVAIEQVVGELEGKVGSFVLQHFGTQQGGDSFLLLEVVPDSGAGELVGLSGKMAIRIEEGQHFYEFEYGLEGSVV